MSCLVICTGTWNWTTLGGWGSLGLTSFMKKLGRNTLSWGFPIWYMGYLKRWEAVMLPMRSATMRRHPWQIFNDDKKDFNLNHLDYSKCIITWTSGIIWSCWAYTSSRAERDITFSTPIKLLTSWHIKISSQSSLNQHVINAYGNSHRAKEKKWIQTLI